MYRGNAQKNNTRNMYASQLHQRYQLHSKNAVFEANKLNLFESIYLE